MKTLLEKAKEIKTTRKTLKLKNTDEHIDLAIAWAKDEIALGQVSQVLYGEGMHKTSGGRTLYAMFVYLREGFRKGKIIVK